MQPVVTLSLLCYSLLQAAALGHTHACHEAFDQQLHFHVAALTTVQQGASEPHLAQTIFLSPLDTLLGEGLADDETRDSVEKCVCTTTVALKAIGVHSSHSIFFAQDSPGHACPLYVRYLNLRR